MWIRSQSKMSLIKCNRISTIINSHNASKYKIVNYIGVDIEGDEDYDILGVYYSKERCVEILDEIQKRKNNSLKHSFSSRNDFELGVYNMPLD